MTIRRSLQHTRIKKKKKKSSQLGLSMARTILVSDAEKAFDCEHFSLDHLSLTRICLLATQITRAKYNADVQACTITPSPCKTSNEHEMDIVMNHIEKRWVKV